MTVRTTTLPSGLRIVTDGYDSELVTISIAVETGTCWEPPHLNGLAHFQEHMAFKGTHTRTSQQITGDIESYGGWLNACTGKDVTSFYAGVLREDMYVALDVLSDIVCNSTLPPDEFELERNVIYQEMRDVEDNPVDWLGDRFMETAFTGGLGMPILGTMETLPKCSVEDLWKFIHDHYTAGRIIVGAAGGVRHDIFVEKATKAFAGVLWGSENPVAPESKYQGGKFTKVAEGEQVNILMAFPSFSLGHRDLQADVVYSAMLAGCNSSRLFRELRETRGLCYEIGRMSYAWKQGGISGVRMSCGSDDAPEAIRVLCAELQRAQDGLAEAEIEMGIKLARANLVMASETSYDRLGSALHHVGVHGKAYDIVEELGKFAAVDRAAIRRAIEMHRSGPPTIAIRGPQKVCEIDIEGMLR